MAEPSTPPQARRSFLRLAAGALLGLAVAACQAVPSGAPRRPPPVDQVPETPRPDAPRNGVAVLVPLSGTNAGVGQSIANAANLALLDTGGKDIRLTIYDTARGAQAAANQALAEGNRLFLGPLLAEDVRAVAPIARGAGVPVIAFSNDVTVSGRGVYVMGYDPSQSIERVVRYARSQNLQRFAGLVPDADYGRRAGQALVASVQRNGGRLVAMQTYGSTPQSMRTAVTRLNGQGAYDAVLIADTGRDAVALAPLIRSGNSRSARILGTELWKAEAGLSRSSALHGAWYASVPDNMFNQLRTRYRARYGANPYRLASFGYDAVLLAVRISRDWRTGRPFPEQKLSDPGGFVGVDGAFRFGRNGVAERMLEVEQIGPGGPTIVSPAPKSFGG